MHPIWTTIIVRMYLSTVLFESKSAQMSDQYYHDATVMQAEGLLGQNA